MGEQKNWLNEISQTTLTPLVRQAVSNDTAVITTWVYQPVYGGAGGFTAIYRFTGHAQVGEQSVPWSLILKVSQAALGSPDPNSPIYWKREALVYQSGFLERLTGEFVAPRCYAIHTPSEDEVWLWLEDIQDVYGKHWPFERRQLAARHLGYFNGRYLTQEPLPTGEWVSQQWLRARMAQTAPVMARFSELLHQPLAQRFYPAEIAQGYQQVWAKRESLLIALDGLPQTLCHRDIYRRNLFARRDQHGREQTVVIDWSDVGIGAIGEELASFVVTDAFFDEVDVADLPRLDQLAFAGYLDGLRAAGWTGSAQVVRLGYAAAAVMRCGLAIIQILPHVLDPTRRVSIERALGHPIEEVVDHWLPIHQFLLRLAEEAQELIDE